MYETIISAQYLVKYLYFPNFYTKTFLFLNLKISPFDRWNKKYLKKLHLTFRTLMRGSRMYKWGGGSSSNDSLRTLDLQL